MTELSPRWGHPSPTPRRHRGPRANTLAVLVAMVTFVFYIDATLPVTSVAYLDHDQVIKSDNGQRESNPRPDCPGPDERVEYVPGKCTPR